MTEGAEFVPKIKGNVVISDNAVPLTAELAARMLFGISLDRLGEDVLKNPNKYNDLFAEDEA